MNFMSVVPCHLVLGATEGSARTEGWARSARPVGAVRALPGVAGREVLSTSHSIHPAEEFTISTQQRADELKPKSNNQKHKANHRQNSVCAPLGRFIFIGLLKDQSN